MSRVRAFGRFWWAFVAGDDWRLALGIALALTVTAILASAGLPAWWFLPVAIAVLFGFSLTRDTDRG